MTRTQIINETVEFYSADVNRRASTETGCHYSITEDNVTRKCAVGRCMTQKALDTNAASGLTVLGLSMEIGIDNLLQKKYNGHSVEFWRSVQRLHDADSHWSNNGLSEIGKSRADHLLETYKD